MIKFDVFHTSASFIAMTDDIKYGSGEIIPPTPELISEFIMTHKEQTVFITNAEYDILVKADKGKVISCVDDKFLAEELQPAIDDYDNFVKRWNDIRQNVFENEEETDEDLEM